ncbi:hypothetical protein SDC9_95472 [bioreactor metagenome]|uniref:Enoyl reductase (ER) domain-containing protein n=1 Tax=bioreactor metagenome TaxID=1076179 RepID=A0A645A6E4_9ZZZZ
MTFRGQNRAGAYAEYARIDAGMAMHTPDSLSDEEAACIPEAMVTAHHVLLHLGEMQPGARVLVHGAGGGVTEPVFGADDEVLEGVFFQAVLCRSAPAGSRLPGVRRFRCGGTDGRGGFFLHGFVSGFQFVTVIDPADFRQGSLHQVIVLFFDDAGKKIVGHTEAKGRSFHGERCDFPEPLTVQRLIQLFQAVRGDRPDFRHAVHLRIHSIQLPVLLHQIHFKSIHFTGAASACL